MTLLKNIKSIVSPYKDSYVVFFYHHTRLLITVGLVFCCMLFVGLFMGPRTYGYSFANTNCFTNLTLLPDLLKTNEQSMKISYEGRLKVLNRTIISKRSCLNMSKLTKENSTLKIKTSLFGRLNVRSLSVGIPAYPTASTNFQVNKVAVNEPLMFKLSVPDNTFVYYLMVGDKKVKCDSSKTTLKCDIAKLNLDQGYRYNYSLLRSFASTMIGTKSLITKSELTTVKPLVMTSGTIVNGSTVYDRRKAIDLSFDKDLKEVKNYELIKDPDGAKIAISTKINYNANNFSIITDSEFARKSYYRLRIIDAKALDGGILTKPIDINFYVSDGPTVVSTNLKSRSMDNSQNLVLTFDQPIITTQNLKDFISVYANNKIYDANLYLSNNKVTIDPKEDLPKCSKFNVKVTPGILSNHSIASTLASDLSGQTGCFYTNVVGNTVGGRAIISYVVGSGPAVMYIAGIHGNESNGSRLLYRWIDEIDGSPWRLPTNKKIVIIPSLNPDGLAKNQRLNNRGVDLNRNFPSNDWKSEVKMQWGELLIGGGGSSALSEPESKAIADYISSINPYLVVSYHSWAAISEANEAGDSTAKARQYSNKSGYRFTTINTNTIFNYDTTGSLEAWLADKKMIATVLVELASKSYDEFNRNKEAMWSMTQ